MVVNCGLSMSPEQYLRTSELAKAMGIHPNTVRLYERWGLIPLAGRSPAGYRRFTQKHMDCLRLARLVYAGFYPGKVIRRSGVQIIRKVVSGDLGGALELAYRHKALVQAERAQADMAASLLEHWAQGSAADATSQPLLISQTAELMGVSMDILRNWERNGLIQTPRNTGNNYRLYGPQQIGRLRVIRTLSRAGYSMMAILRMLNQLDAGRTEGLRQALDTPGVNEDIVSASDRWLSTLVEQEAQAEKIILQLEAMMG